MRDNGDFSLVTFCSLYEVLGVLSGRERMRKGEITKALSRSNRRVTAYLAQLRDLGLVQQQIRFTGRTGVQGHYALTPRGVEALEAMRKLVEILEREPEEPVMVIAKVEATK